MCAGGFHAFREAAFASEAGAAAADVSVGIDAWRLGCSVAAWIIRNGVWVHSPTVISGTGLEGDTIAH